MMECLSIFNVDHWDFVQIDVKGAWDHAGCMHNDIASNYRGSTVCEACNQTDYMITFIVDDQRWALR